MNIYAGNLSCDASENDLLIAFESYGRVTSVNIVKDDISGESKGFGYIEMPSRLEAEKAVSGLNRKIIKGRTIMLQISESDTDGKGRKQRTRRTGKHW